MFILRSVSISLFIIFLSSINIFAQSTYDKEITAGEYEKIERKLFKEASKTPDDLMVNFDLSVLYNSSKYSNFNPDTAYYFGKRAETIYNNLPTKQREKLIRKTIYLSVIRDQILATSANLYTKYSGFNTIEGYEYYINHFRDSQDLLSKAIAGRNELAFQLASNDPTVEKVQQFITKYPKAIQIKVAVVLRDSLDFENAKTTNTSFGYLSFMQRRPNSHLYSDARLAYDKAYFLERIDCKNVPEIIAFIKQNSKNSFIPSVCDSLFLISRTKDDFNGLRFYVENCTDGQYQEEAWDLYYDSFTRDGFVETLTRFYGLYNPTMPAALKSIYEKEYEVALLGSSLELSVGYNPKKDSLYWKYMSLASNKDLAFSTLQTVIAPAVIEKKWNEALFLVEKAMPLFGSQNKKVANLYDVLKAPAEILDIKTLGNKVNTNSGDEYVPIISADNRYLYFCGSKRRDNEGGEDIFISENKEGVWQNPQIIKQLATPGNDAPLSISTDGTRLLLFINGDIYYSMRTATGWGAQIAFPAPINSAEWEGDAMLTSDGKALLFVSKRAGGQNPIYYDQDIYISVKTEDGWGEPINLGKTINSRFIERSPYLHSDMKTLYFSSAGHGGLGDLDVYMSKRLNDSTWTEWSEPVNVGKEINSVGQDWGYRVTTSGEKAYFSMVNSSDNHDLFTLTLPMRLRPYNVATLSGYIVDLSRNPISGTIRWEDLEIGTVIGESKSDPRDGSFFVVLPLGKRYGYYAEKEGHFPVSRNIDLTKEVKAATQVDTIVLSSYELLVNKDYTVPINNLFFDVDRDEILPSSYAELNRIAQIINDKGFRIEISGHTDNSGTKEHNVSLSLRRANAVANYLATKGIFMRAMTTVGYGDEKPVAPNTTEEGKARNRRVELKFVK